LGSFPHTGFEANGKTPDGSRDLKFWAALALLCSTLGLPNLSFGGPVELHAHLFMKEGMTWAFRGDFFGPLEATSWEDRFSSQANPETLEKSGLSIVVAALYAHPLFTLDLRESIRRQVALARKFVLTHPDWVLAGNPQQAQYALDNDQHVMILSLEGASGILENESDLKEFVDEDQIRIVNPVHLTDDEYGGVAFLKGFRVLSSPWAWLKQLLSPWYVEGVRTNHAGLTDRGRWLAQALIDHHVWMDLSHASDQSARELIQISRDQKKPLLFTHTVLRRFHEAERGISDEEIAAVKESHGIIGLMPSEEMLEGAPRPAQCPSAIASLAKEYGELVSKIGMDSVTLGSDYNGGIPHLAPTGPGCITETSIDREGLWNIGQTADVWKAIARLGVPTPQDPDLVARHFIEVWAQAFGKKF
jgi:microsomal dipeptidase-like Zn-dependent dipeptidase